MGSLKGDRAERGTSRRRCQPRMSSCSIIPTGMTVLHPDGEARLCQGYSHPGQGASLILRKLGVPTAAGQHEARACSEGTANTQPQADWADAVMGSSTGGFAFPQRKSLLRGKSQSKHPLMVFTRLNQSQSSTETCPTAFPQSHSWRAWTWLLAGVFNIARRRL